MTLHEIAPAIAAALGPGWTAEIDKENPDVWAKLKKADPPHTISLWADHRGKRIEISADHHKWPEAVDGPHNSRYVDIARANGVETIGVSADKTPTKIAADITRRFLPAYLAALNAILAWNEQHNAYIAKQNAVLQMVRSRVGGEIRDEVVHSTLVGDVRCSAESVRIDVSLTPEIANRVLDVLDLSLTPPGVRDFANTIGVTGGVARTMIRLAGRAWIKRETAEEIKSRSDWRYDELMERIGKDKQRFEEYANANNLKVVQDTVYDAPRVRHRVSGLPIPIPESADG